MSPPKNPSKPPKPSASYEKLLKNITLFGEKTGLKRVRVRLKDTEAEVEFHGEPSSLTPSSPTKTIHGTASHEGPKPSSQSSASIQDYDNNPQYKVIRSPLVGTFYRCPSPGTKPFVDVGDRVEKGTTLAIIEAMKLMNELDSENSGTIEKILIENGTPVEFDQPLFVLSV